MQVSLQPQGGTPPGALGLLKTLRVGIVESIDGLDPRCGAADATALILGQIFEAAATLFEGLRSEDEAGTLFSAAVQPEVRFSDGTL